MSNIEFSNNNKSKFSKLEKIFYLAVLTGTIYLIVNGFNEYKEIMEHPSTVRGVVYNKELYSNGNGDYRWNIYYSYKVNDELYKSKLIDQSPFSKDFSIGDSLFVYYNELNYQKSIALKNPQKTQIKPSILDFMLRDSKNGYLLILVVLTILVYTLPVLVHLIYIVLIGLSIRIFDHKKSDLFFETGFSKIIEQTYGKINGFINRW
jgi:hypothetical protein